MGAEVSPAAEAEAGEAAVGRPLYFFYERGVIILRLKTSLWISILNKIPMSEKRGYS